MRKLKKDSIKLSKYIKRGAIIVGYIIALIFLQQINVFGAEDPVAVVNNLSNFIFGLI